jgi:hypothetical protein
VAVDPARVASLYADGPAGKRAGSGYLVGTGAVLTAAHVVTDAGLAVGDRLEVMPFAGDRWLPAEVAWLGTSAGSGQVDAALVRLGEQTKWKEPVGLLRWGRLAGNSPVSAAAIGYPWAQERPDMRRGTEHVVGFITPPPNQVTGLLDLTVLTSAPSDPPGGGSPWAGMSGAALMAGPYLAGIVLVDPARYGSDRLSVLPVARLFEIDSFRTALGNSPNLVDIGTEWRFKFRELSVRLAPAYHPIPKGYHLLSNPYRLLEPRTKVAHIPGREDVIDEIVNWAIQTSSPLAIKTISGIGGSGKTRLAAEVCLSIAGSGWDAGFADFSTARGEDRFEFERPTLIVIDDANLQFRSAAALVEATIYGAGKVRLLLLTRGRSGWWKQFDAASGNNAVGFDHGDLVLDNHRLNPDERQQLYQLAHQRFREELDAPAADAPDIDLSAVEFGAPLLIQLTALVAALGSAIDPGKGPAGDLRSLVLRAAVDREATRWIGTLRAEHQIEANDRLVRRCVTTASLTTPHADDPDSIAKLQDAAAALLRAVPELDQTDKDRLFTLADWLHNLHRGPTYWNPLRPDPLCDQLLADLDVLPELTETLIEMALSNRDTTSLSRLFAELARASEASAGAARRTLNRVLAPTGSLEGSVQ